MTTDFGLTDPYVAEMKAVILGINPKATIVDISHQIEKFNARMGAFILACAAQYFPKNTIHIAVVDPGVGTKRRSIIIQTRRSYFVGPDNGVLALAVENEGIYHVYEIRNPKYMLPKVSRTFHGRDVFAPAAAYLSNGISPAEFGPEIRKIETPTFAKVCKGKDKLVGEVLHIDSFGNVVTNFQEAELELVGIKKDTKIEVKGTTFKLRIRKAYGEAKRHELLAVIGSHNFLEISMNQGNAAEEIQIKVGDEVTLYYS